MEINLTYSLKNNSDIRLQNTNNANSQLSSRRLVVSRVYSGLRTLEFPEPGRFFCVFLYLCCDGGVLRGESWPGGAEIILACPES